LRLRQEANFINTSLAIYNCQIIQTKKTKKSTKIIFYINTKNQISEITSMPCILCNVYNCNNDKLILRNWTCLFYVDNITSEVKIVSQKKTYKIKEFFFWHGVLLYNDLT
jgi:hypothetical protein